MDLITLRYITGDLNHTCDKLNDLVEDMASGRVGDTEEDRKNISRVYITSIKRMIEGIEKIIEEEYEND